MYCLLWLIPPTNHGVTPAVNSVSSFAAHRDLFPFIRSIVLITSPVNLIPSPSICSCARLPVLHQTLFLMHYSFTHPFLSLCFCTGLHQVLIDWSVQHCSVFQPGPGPLLCCATVQTLAVTATGHDRGYSLLLGYDCLCQ